MSVVLYFGRWGGPGSGHDLHGPLGGWRPIPFPLTRGQVDGGFCPGGANAPREDQIEGLAALHHVDRWTVLAFWDRSADDRHGSHSTFLVEGAHAFDEAGALARKAFPAVWSRYPFAVRPIGSSRGKAL